MEASEVIDLENNNVVVIEESEDEDNSAISHFIAVSNDDDDKLIDLSIEEEDDYRFHPLATSTQTNSDLTNVDESNSEVQNNSDVNLRPSMSMLSCHFCDLSLSSSLDLLRHLRLAHKPKHERLRRRSSLNIEAANSSTRNKLAIQATQRSHASRDGIVVQSRDKTRSALEQLSGFTSIRGRSYVKHTEYTTDPRRPHQCSLCPVRCTTRGHLQQHVESVHKEDREGKRGKTLLIQRCPKCSFQSTNASSFRRHVKWTHVQERHVWCQICGMDLKSSAKLKEHKMRFHPHLLTFHCDLCDYRTDKQGSLKNHQRIKHSP